MRSKAQAYGSRKLANPSPNEASEDLRPKTAPGRRWISHGAVATGNLGICRTNPIAALQNAQQVFVLGELGIGHRIVGHHFGDEIAQACGRGRRP